MSDTSGSIMDSVLDTTFRNGVKGIINYWPTVFIIIFFIIGCSVGIDIHSKCKIAQDSKLYNNLRETLNYGLAAGIASLVTISILNVTKGANAKMIGLLFALIAVITSGMSVGMFYKCKDENYGSRKKALETFAWLSLIIPILSGIFLAIRK